MEKLFLINPKDTVAVALEDLTKGQAISLQGAEVILNEDIPKGHKVSIKPIIKGELIVKYGEPIGEAKMDIGVYTHVHTHNMTTRLDRSVSYSYTETKDTDFEIKEDYFEGYVRSDNRVGVRNEIWIIPTVGCVNDVARAIANLSNKNLPENVDAVVSLTHPYGCSQTDSDQENTRRILASLINHPNAGGVLVLGLGCENSNISVLKPYIGDDNLSRIRFLECQNCDNEIEEGALLVSELIRNASEYRRERVSTSRLVVGLKCGGSDGLSGITANPSVGVFSDLLIKAGGSTILTEVPEMFGAETLLMKRCRNRSVFDKTVSLINDFKNYFTSHGQTVYENPSPGNKQGGITTLEDKSLGCTQKSGTSSVCDVLSYGDMVSKSGLNLLSAPGNDLVASTALASAGAQIILFTTGRGTPFASPVPTLKISSNTDLYNKKQHWIDFDAGRAVLGLSIEDLGSELYKLVLETASGRKSKSEIAGFHDMAIFKQGVTL